MVQFSENLSSVTTFPDWFQVGHIQLLLVDTLMPINIWQLTWLWTSLVNLSCSFNLMMDLKKTLSRLLHTTSRALDAWWVCTTLLPQSEPSQRLAYNTLLTEDIPLNYLPRTPSSRSMMVSSKISSKRLMIKNSSIFTRQSILTTNIDWSMIWSPKLLKVMAVLFGLARITMVMSKVTSSPKVTDLSVSWLQFFSMKTMS